MAKSASKKITVKINGKPVVQSGTSNTYQITWTASGSGADDKYCEKFECVWQYKAGKTWFKGEESDAKWTDPRSTTYTPPSNAEYIRFRIRAVSKTHGDNNKEYFKASWVGWVTTDKLKTTQIIGKIKVNIDKIIYADNYPLRATLTL